MKYILAAVAVLALTPTSAFAAVSGFYDSAEKINTILASSAVADALRQAPIGQITNSGAGEWLIQTQDCDLVVHLVAVPPAGVGKTTYRVDVPKACE